MTNEGSTHHVDWTEDTDEECGITYTDRIIGGTNASLGQYPWLARIGYRSKRNQFSNVIILIRIIFIT